MTWFEKIHQRAVQCSRQFKKAEYEMVLALQAVDAKKVYRKVGYASLFEYAVKALLLPEGTAYNFINVARKSVKMPQITESLSKGTATVAQFKHVLSVITPQTQKEWIQKVETLSQRELKREVVKADPDKRGKIKFECLVEIRFEEKIQRIKEVLSQKTRKVASLEEALNAMADEYLDRNDPVQVAARQQERRSKLKIRGNVQSNTQPTSVAPPVQPEPGRAIRQALPQKIIQAIYLRDQGTCQYQDCKHRTFLDIHHIKPKSQGGPDTTENLILLCKSHHAFIHHGLRYP
jgi:hypothetical protein